MAEQILSAAIGPRPQRPQREAGCPGHHPHEPAAEAPRLVPPPVLSLQRGQGPSKYGVPFHPSTTPRFLPFFFEKSVLVYHEDCFCLFVCLFLYSLFFYQFTGILMVLMVLS